MKLIKQLLVITGSALIIVSCQNAGEQQRIESEADSMATDQSTTDNTMMDNNASTNSQYVDLKTGQPVDLYYNEKKKRTYSATTDEPVDLYVNVATGDTIYGEGRYVVNNYLVKTSDGTYKLDDSKIKVSKDGIKIKDGDKKLKIEEGEMKMKDGDKKYKADEDEEKMKTDDQKTKTEDGVMKNKNK